MTDHPEAAAGDHRHPAPPGGAIVRAAWAATAALSVTATAATASDATAVRTIAAATALGLFAVGVGTFFAAYAIAVARSRTDSIGIGGLFFLAGEGTAPDKRHANQLRAALAAQVVIAVATAAARPFSSLAFGVLAPLSALGLTGLYGARHGRFGPRRDHRNDPRRRPARTTDAPDPNH